MNVVGQWLRLFDTDEKGKKIQSSVIDTLCFFPDKNYLRFETGGKTTASWTLNQKKKRINLVNQNFTAFIGGQLIQQNFGDGHYNIDKVMKDTLVLVRYKETVERQLHKKEYYKRIK
jgi:hypothetical protein